MDPTPPRAVSVVLASWPLPAVLMLTAVAVVGLVALGWRLWAAPVHAQESDAPEPPPALVILARSDNPADALASGPVGGVLGAPVLLTPRGSLHAATADALRSIDPDLVVLAGGTAALSDVVEQAVADLGYATRRAAGADRHETAVLVSALLAEWVTPQQRIAELEGQVAALEDRVAGFEGQAAGLEGQVAALEDRVAGLEATLAGVTRAAVDGRDTLTFAGMNVQLVNGTGDTAGEPNGLGNLVIGYNAQRPEPFDQAERTGSHYLVVGDAHEWTAYGGILAGLHNTATGPWASVTGGHLNTATGDWASVSGGNVNAASGDWASVSGGLANTASGGRASVSGGNGNEASGFSVSILGGFNQTVSGDNACHPSC